MKKIVWKPFRSLTQPPVEALSDWLLHAGSFMQRLKQFGVTKPRVQVLNEGWIFPFRTECELLNIPPRTYALVREVLIDSVEGRWMFARTVIPAKTLSGKELQLAKLKNRSLGTLLFKDPHLQRSEFEFAWLDPDMFWHNKIRTENKLWARRSIFYLSQKPLLLSEIFSPAVAALKNDG